MNIAAPKGTYDVFPLDEDAKEAWRSCHIWHYVENSILQLCRLFDYQEIRTPIFERIEVFQKSVGDTSDIVSKEMYVFRDKGERTMVLRPEGTSAVMRAFIEEKAHTALSVHKLYYLGPMFRYERPQAGRYRQHMQFGVEIVGNKSAEQDAEAILFLWQLYQKLGLQNLKININSVGDLQSRKQYRQALIDYFTPLKNQLSEESLSRLEVNPLRILDSKDPQDRSLLGQAPSILNYLNQSSQSHFQTLQETLKALQIPFEVNDRLVRGLDYYNNTVFEITTESLGAQNTIGAGGRYDGLLKMMGGPDLPAVGFATGIERLIQTLLIQKAEWPQRAAPVICLIPMGSLATRHCLTLASSLRDAQIAAVVDLSGHKVKDGLQYANQIHAKYIAVIGDDELASNEVHIKELATRAEQNLKMSDLITFLTRKN